MWKLSAALKDDPSKLPPRTGASAGQTQIECGQGKGARQAHRAVPLYYTAGERIQGLMVGRSHFTPFRPSQRTTQTNITHRRGSGQPLPTIGKYSLTNAEGNLSPSGEL